MGTPRVQHSALPSPAPSRCGAPCLARNSMESLQHRVAVAPPASSAAAASRCGTESPRHPLPRPQQQRLAEPHKRPLRQLRCRHALSGSACGAHTTRHRAPRHLVRRRPFGPRVRNPIVTKRRAGQEQPRQCGRWRGHLGPPAQPPAEPQQAAVASPCTSTPAAARPTDQTAPAPAALSLRTQRLGMRGAHDAPPRASPPRAQAALRAAGPQPDCQPEACSPFPVQGSSGLGPRPSAGRGPEPRGVPSRGLVVGAQDAPRLVHHRESRRSRAERPVVVEQVVHVDRLVVDERAAGDRAHRHDDGIGFVRARHPA